MRQAEVSKPGKTTRAVDTIRIGFIGTGGRSWAWAQHLVDDPRVVISALADPNRRHVDRFRERFELGDDTLVFEDHQTMLEAIDDLDAVVICTPNFLHAKQAERCFERGLAVALEKPLATDPESCRRVLEADRRGGGRSMLGFVLRSSPVYAKIHELIHSGRIGRLLSIQADELCGMAVSSIMNRSAWRRYRRTGGGAMLEKCCHDIDLFNWMTGSRPRRLSSFGGQRQFNPNPSLPERCDDCRLAETCDYYKRPARSGQEDPGEDTLQGFIRDDNICVFNVDKDIADVQSVAIEYESGVVVNFLYQLNCFGTKAGRNFHAIGTKGRVWATLADGEVFHFDNGTKQQTRYDCSGDGSGHGGGDRRHAQEFIRLIEDPQHSSAADLYAGYLSAMICFAAERSMLTHRTVDFRYLADGIVDFA